MTDTLEQYDSNSNVALSRQQSMKSLRQCGTFKFKLAPNKSGKTRITYATAFQVKPNLNIMVSVISGSVLDEHHALEKVDETGFTLHVSNNDCVNEMQCEVMWWSSPF